MTENQASGSGTGRTLFFGRKDCDGTKSALQHLQTLGFDVEFVTSDGPAERLSDAAKAWKGDYIFCFRSHLILPGSLIEQARVAAINFHPAPPEYPGSGCLNFALYDGADRYGVTAHLMNEKIDNGHILSCVRFPIQEDDQVNTLLVRTHTALLSLFKAVTSAIARDGQSAIDGMLAEAQSEQWRGLARKMRDLNALQHIDATIGESELARRIRAVHTKAFPLTLSLHGNTFTLKL